MLRCHHGGFQKLVRCLLDRRGWATACWVVETGPPPAVEGAAGNIVPARLVDQGCHRWPADMKKVSTKVGVTTAVVIMCAGSRSAVC